MCINGFLKKMHLSNNEKRRIILIHSLFAATLCLSRVFFSPAFIKTYFAALSAYISRNQIGGEVQEGIQRFLIIRKGSIAPKELFENKNVINNI